VRILFFGGTGFVGRHAAAACIARGHEVTLFCRGLSDPAALPAARRITGERTDPRALARIDAQAFDAVVDTCGYLPREVRAALRALETGAMHYVFVSTLSVYKDRSRPPNPSSPLADPIDADDAVLSVEGYAGLKVACERAITDALGSRACIVRPGRILGPHDSDPRAPWFLRRVAAGGEMLASGDPDAPVQFIDARDLGEFLAVVAERRTPGVFDAAAPPVTARAIHETAREVTESDARFTWVPDDILLANGVSPFTEAPFWLPRASEALMRVDASPAFACGLPHRPMRDTLRDEWTWMLSGWEAAATVRAQKKLDVPAGLSSEREKAILGAFAAASRS
jgi:2'-hydroxyisoflavone reductase